jgi:CBS domain-containing protein
MLAVGSEGTLGCPDGKEDEMTRSVKDVMTRAVVSVNESTPFKEIARLLAEQGVSAVPVMDAGGHVRGMVSEADLILREEGVPEGKDVFAGMRRRHEVAKMKGRVASDLMTSPAVTVRPEAPITEAARLLHRHHLKRLPVVDAEGRLVGILSRADLVKMFLRPDEEIRDEVVHRVIEGILWIDPRTLTVKVHEGVVTLGGEVEHKNLVPLFVHLVRGVDGVVDVEEHLTYRFDDTWIRPEGWLPWPVRPYPARRT